MTDKHFDHARFLAAIDETGVSDEALAVAAGCTARTIENYRRGVTEPSSYVTLCALASKLGLQVEDLFRKGE